MSSYPECPVCGELGHTGCTDELISRLDRIEEVVGAACFGLTQGNPHLERSRVFSEVAQFLRDSMAEILDIGPEED